MGILYKKNKTKLVMGFMGVMMALMGIGFSQVGQAEESANSPQAAYQNFSAALANWVAARDIAKKYPDSADRQSDLVSTAEDVAESLDQIYGGLENASVANRPTWQTTLETAESLIAAEQGSSLLGNNEDIASATGLETGGSNESDNNALENGNNGENSVTNEGDDPEGVATPVDESDDDELAENPGSGEGDATTQNPVSDSPITFVNAEAPAISDPRDAISTNPEGSFYSVDNPFVGAAPTINPKAPYINPDSNGTVDLSSVEGEIQIRDPNLSLINPDPEQDTGESAPTPFLKIASEPISTIDPNAPVTSTSLTNTYKQSFSAESIAY